MGPCYFDRSSLQNKSLTTWTSFSILLISSSILTIISWSCSRYLSMIALNSPDYGYFVSLSLTACAIGILQTPFMQRIQFEEHGQVFIKITIFSSLVSILLRLITVVFLNWGIEGILLAQLLSTIMTFLLFFIFGSRGTTFLCSRHTVRELLRLGLPLVPSFAFLFILMRGNQYILESFEGMDQVGIYSVGLNIGMVMGIATGAASTAWYPFFMSYIDNQCEAKTLFGRIFTYYLYSLGTICLLFFIGAKLIILLITQPAFHQASLIVGLAASAQFFSGLFNMLLPGVYFAKEIKYVSFTQGLAAIFSVVINLILIKLGGLFGAALGLALSHFLMTVFQWIWNAYRKEHYIQVEYEWRRIFSFTFVFFVFSIASFIPRTTSNWIEFGYTICLTFSLLIIVLLLMKDNERNFLQNRICMTLGIS